MLQIVSTDYNMVDGVKFNCHDSESHFYEVDF